MSAVRDDLRSKIFAGTNKKLNSEVLEIWGQQLEIRQPTLGQILSTRTDDNRQEGIIRLMIDYCFVPGTNERVFDEGDFQQLMTMPFGDEIRKVNESINRLIGVNAEEVKNSSTAT